MADNSVTTILLLGAAGMGAYYLYENWGTLFPAVVAPGATPSSIATAFPLSTAALSSISPNILNAAGVASIQATLTAFLATSPTASQIAMQDSATATSIQNMGNAYTTCGSSAWNPSTGACSGSASPTPTISINQQALNDSNFMSQAMSALAQRGYINLSPGTMALPIIQQVVAGASSTGMSLQAFESAVLSLLANWTPAPPPTPTGLPGVQGISLIPRGMLGVY